MPRENWFQFVIYAYGDDGADERQQRSISVAVAVGWEDWWKEIEPRWVERCNGIPFHAKDCESNQGDYKGIPEKENKAMYRDLATLLAESKIVGVGHAIDLSSRNDLFPKAERMDFAYYECFKECLIHLGTMGLNFSEKVEIEFDISSENEWNAGLLYRSLRESSTDLIKWLHPKISFAPAKEEPRLQIVDMLAYEAWKVLDHAVGPIHRSRRSWNLLAETRRFKVFAYSRGYYEGVRKDIDSGRFYEQVNSYQNWLNLKHRQSNMSNFIEFLGAQTKTQ